jgi:hypothetical protein
VTWGHVNPLTEAPEVQGVRAQRQDACASRRPCPCSAPASVSPPHAPHATAHAQPRGLASRAESQEGALACRGDRDKQRVPLPPALARAACPLPRVPRRVSCLLSTHATGAGSFPAPGSGRGHAARVAKMAAGTVGTKGAAALPATAERA